MASKIAFVILLIVLVDPSRSLELKAKAYEDLTISISDNVPSQYCKTILANLEVSDKLLCKHFLRANYRSERNFERFCPFKYLPSVLSILISSTVVIKDWKSKKKVKSEKRVMDQG